MKVAAYQAPLLPSGSMDAVELIRRRVEWCEANGVAVLLCPEAVLGGLADDAPRPSDLALTVEGGQLRALLAPFASALVTTIVGFTEAGGDGDLYNSAAVFSKGEVIGIYRKRHPAIRSSVYRPGDQSPVFTLGDLSFGIMICNDSNFPELGTSMAARGARVLFVPSNNGLRPERADVVDLTRAADIAQAKANGVAVIRADVAGDTGERISIGSSAIIDSEGRVLQSGKPLTEELLVADLRISSACLNS
jgi:predicted amidohydrolase